MWRSPFSFHPGLPGAISKETPAPPVTPLVKHLCLLVTLILLLPAARSSGAEPAEPPELKPEVFRFVRAKKKVYPPVIQDGKTITPGATVVSGVFTFRYSHATPLVFWAYEEPKERAFSPIFTWYQVKKDDAWKPLRFGYCGTGSRTFALQPGVDYELEINLSVPDVSDGTPTRVSVNSPDGTFWSEPFVFQTP